MIQFDHLFIQPRDYSKSLHFYTELLGWKVKYSHGSAEDAGRLSYLVYNDMFTLVLAEDHDTSDPAKKPEIYRTKGKVSLHFKTDDVDAAFKTIRDGAHVITHPENTHWNTRWFVVEDPDGNQFGWQGPPKA